MPFTEPGFHPWASLAHRLGKISPHRQVQLLGLISVATVGIIVTTVFLSLTPTHDSLSNSSHRLVPTMQRLGAAQHSYNATADALRRIVDADLTERAAGINELTTLNTAGAAAWDDYVGIAAGLPHERMLQRTFVADRKVALVTGAAFVSAPAPTTDALVQVTNLADKLQFDLNQIKALYEGRVQQSLRDATDEVGSTRLRIRIVTGITAFFMLVAFGVAIRSARSREERLAALDRTLHEDAERNELEARLQRSLEMARTEADAYAVVGRALAVTAPGLPAELIVADSSRAHFRRVAATDEIDAGCPVLSPAECPAATWGQTQVWTSSTALDACPELRGRPSGDCSAVCVPVSVAGNAIGVVHATGPDGHPPVEAVVGKVELTARKFGERVGMLRAFQRSETQARTDPLTGLMNRRSLNDKVRSLAEDGSTFVAAYGDLDHFKQLNDVYGHDAGDQALRLFARVMRDSVRPNDLTARYGGEEFVIVLPDCTISDAYAVINRLREALAVAQADERAGAFTVSFGITAARPEHTFSETLEIADAALLKAKSTGRDRIVISGEGEDPSAAAAEGSDHGAAQPTQ